MEMIRYILIASACLSLFYLAYRLIFRQEENFRQMRIFLLLSVAISLLIPLYTGHIDLQLKRNNVQATTHYKMPVNMAGSAFDPQLKEPVNLKGVFIKVYVLVAAILMLRILAQLTVLSWHYAMSEKIRKQEYVLLINRRIKMTFSFFNWIFIHPASLKNEDLEQIIAHEKVHAHQYHSADLVIMEILACLMWFNPFIWMMKNSIQLVHEYLADEGVINTGIDKLRYQALLINQVSEDKLISLFSGFNHSLIKKRMKKMLNSRLNRGSRFKWIAFLPVAACLLLLMAILNGFLPENSRAAGLSPAPPVGFSKGDTPFYKKETGDTIKKKIIKITNRNGKIDTTVNETFDIVDRDKAAKEKSFRYKTVIKDGDSTRYVYVVKDGDPDEIMVNVDDDPEILIDHDENGEIHKEVKVITITKGTGTSTSSSTSVSTGKNDNVPSNTLVIIDGVKHTDKNALSSLDPDKIESMNVIRDKKMMKQYTDKEYEGVIIIKTKQIKK